MTKDLKPGDKVRWNTSQGPTTGTVEKKLTRPARVQGHKAEASPVAPQFKVRSDKTGAEAIHKPGSLRKT
jgi:Hypervirulence associated proteins TUDOR domain